MRPRRSRSFLRSVKIANPMGGAHTPEMVAAAGSEYGMDNGLNFVKGLVMTAVDLMTQPEKLAAIKEEFSHVNDEPQTVR